MDKWIGVDLDGTLAFWDGWRDDIGPPIMPMINRVKKWLKEGKEVRIFTARVGACGKSSGDSGLVDSVEFANAQRKLIEDWCEKHIGQRLKVTATKDFEMVELFDDRAREVIENTGFLKNEYNR